MHPKLRPFSALKYLRRFDKAIKIIDKELQSIGCLDWSIDAAFLEDKRSFLQKFFTNQAHDTTVDQTITISGAHEGRPFCVVLPMTKGLLCPYLLDVRFDVRTEGVAVCRRGLLGRKWEHEGVFRPGWAEALANLKLPKVKLDHHWGGYVWKLGTAYWVQPDESDPSKTRWVIQSAFEGFIFGVGPKVAKFLKAAPKLETLLRSYGKG